MVIRRYPEGTGLGIPFLIGRCDSLRSGKNDTRTLVTVDNVDGSSHNRPLFPYTLLRLLRFHRPVDLVATTV